MANENDMITRAEIDQIKASEAAVEKRQIEMEILLRQIHDALMLPQPGQEHSLLDRMAAVTNGIEGGARTAKMVIAILGFMTVIGISVKVGVIK